MKIRKLKMKISKIKELKIKNSKIKNQEKNRKSESPTSKKDLPPWGSRILTQALPQERSVH